MSELNHKKITKEWYEIDFNTSHNHLRRKMNEFLAESPEIDAEDWEENHTILRDFDGDFSGVLIHSCNKTEALLKWICDKLKIDFEEVNGLDFKLVG